MANIDATRKIARNTFIALMLTVVPILLLRQLWFVLVNYWQLILSFFLLGSGVIFIYFYFKSYDLKMMITKIKDLLKFKKSIGETPQEKIVAVKKAERARDLLITGIVAELSGLYFFWRFIEKP